MLEPRQILVAGSMKIKSNYEEISCLAKMIGAKIMHIENWILLNGGISMRSSEGIASIDHLVCLGAQEELRKLENQEMEERILTLRPKEGDYNLANISRVDFHDIGKVEISKFDTPRTQRYELVTQADAIITMQGISHAEDIIKLGMIQKKPVLPIRCTGGQSKER